MEKNNPKAVSPGETDITNVLVGISIVSVVLLVILGMQQVTKSKTSINSRASVLRDTKDDACKNLKPILDEKYSASSDICGAESGASPNYVVDKTISSAHGLNNLCKDGKYCLRMNTPTGLVHKLGDDRCRRLIHSDRGSYCGKPETNTIQNAMVSPMPTQQRKATNIACGIVQNEGNIKVLVDGVCYAYPSPTPTPTLPRR